MQLRRQSKMKKLVKVRLINWHYLANETIELNGNTLLTGPNASGKSTIMDAITYVLTAGDTQTKRVREI